MGVNCLCAFPTPIITLDLVYYNKFRNELIEHIYKTMETTKSALKSNNGGWQSPPVELPHEFSKHIFANVNNYGLEQFLGERWTCQVGNLWYNVNPTGASNDRHTHPGCDLAGVFYVKIPEGECGDLELENPNHYPQFHMLNTMEDGLKDKTKCSHSLWFPPDEGETVIFPSNILHRVLTNNTKEDRISISWNMKIVEK
jgi:uncharacterized protein (TIGR02466 family)